MKVAGNASVRRLEKLLAGYKTETIAVAFHDLGSGAEILIRADESFHPASTFKVAVMMEVFHQAAQGKFSLDEKIPVVNAFTSIADGSPFSTYVRDDSDASLYQKVGATESLREIVRLMIVRSSNLATNILIQKVDAVQVSAYLDELGIQGVKVLRGPEDNKAYARGMNNRATACGLMQMMQALAEERVVSPKASREMLDILLKQEFNEGIPAGLPKKVKVAHKTGWNDKIYHDFGLVFPQSRKPYALAIMTQGFENEIDAHACAASISKLIYKNLS